MSANMAGRLRAANSVIGRRNAEAYGTRRMYRAADEAQLRLRCLGPARHRFKAAAEMRCPMCQHQTEIVGHVS